MDLMKLMKFKDFETIIEITIQFTFSKFLTKMYWSIYLIRLILVIPFKLIF